MILRGSKIQPGRYRHYQGRTYIVIGLARHEVTKEELVVYRSGLGGELKLVPKHAFYQVMNVAGKRVPRFKYLGPG